MEPENTGVELTDPESSPFEPQAAVARLPYKKGSAEDLAIRRVIEEAEHKHATDRKD
jgi:hypothetical protein